jgi:hypothetical protein
VLSPSQRPQFALIRVESRTQLCTTMASSTGNVLSKLALLHARTASTWLERAVGSQSCRLFSSKPDSSVYGGPKTQNPQRQTLRTLRKAYKDGVKLSMVTAYDYPSAVHVRLQANLCACCAQGYWCHQKPECVL